MINVKDQVYAALLEKLNNEAHSMIEKMGCAV